MKDNSGWSVRGRLVGLVGGLLALSGIILGLTLLLFFKEHHRAQLHERGVQMARFVARERAPSLESTTVGSETQVLETSEMATESLQDLISTLGEEPRVVYLLIFDSEGKHLAGVNDQQAQTLLAGEIAPTHPTALSVSERMQGDESFLDILTPIPSKERLGSGQGWVRMGISLKEVETASRQMAGKMVLLLLLLTGCGVWATLFLSRSHETSLERITEAAYRMGDGDLSSHLEQQVAEDAVQLGIGSGFSGLVARLRAILHPIRDVVLQDDVLLNELSQAVQKVKDEIGHRSQLSQKKLNLFENMRSEFQQTLEHVETLSSKTQTMAPTLIEMSTATVQVDDSMSNLASYVEDTASALLQMASSIKQVVEHINALTENMSETTASCARMDALVNEIEARSKESALLAEKVSKDAEGLGGGAIEKTINGMENIKKAVEKSSSVIFKLGERTEYIGKILTVIDEVTRQTNLLALNAAILAAQAGEHGRGFAVVADEIKGLADRTATSTKEIAKLIQDLQSEAQDAVASIREGGQSVEEGVRLSLDARQSLHSILEEANQSSSTSRQIEKSTLAQVQAIRVVNQAMDKMNQMVHQVNSAMNEQGKMIEHITEGSEKMRLITRQVKSATEEQALASKQTSSAIEELARGIQNIGEGMSLQKKDTEAMQVWTMETDQVTDLNRKLCDTMTQKVEQLVKDMQALKTRIGSLKI